MVRDGRHRWISGAGHGAGTDSTGDPARLLQAIDSYRVQGIPFRIEDAGEHVLRLLTAIARQLTEVPGRRKAIVAIGAGWLFDTPLPPPSLRDLHGEWLAAMRAMAAANASLYVIDPVGIRPARGLTSRRQRLRHQNGDMPSSTPTILGLRGADIRGGGNLLRVAHDGSAVERTADLRKVESKCRARTSPFAPGEGSRTT